MATVKHLSFAGVTLPLQTPEHEEWLRQVHPPQLFTEFEGWNFDQPNTSNLPTPSLPQPPDFRVGVLTWPTGAVRPAWFHAVVTTAILDQIRLVVADPMTPQDLVLFDSRTDKTVTASMYLLPARPLNQLGHATSDAWLLTLTDQRFYWHWRRGTISTQPTSWANLYTSLSAILGISIVAEAVDASYGTPSPKWMLRYGPTPVILDAVAEQVGQRVVVALDGTVKTVNWETARDASDNYIATSDPVISGGYLSQSDIARYVPASVNVLFVDTSVTPPAAAPHVINETLVSLAVDGYGSSQGLTGFSQTLYADTPYDGTNTTAVNDYAEAAVTDWYGWRLADLDIVWIGIEPWVPTGWEDCIEWTLQKRESQPFASTMVRRGPWSNFVSGSWKAGTETSPTPPSTDCAPGCGWIAGMYTGWCMAGTVVGAFGQCSGIDTLQSFSILYDGFANKWVSNTNFLYDGGSGLLRVWLDATKDEIAASINNIDLVLDCCGDNYAVFSGGAKIDPTFCTGAIPETPCSPNTFRVKVECSCCPIPNWGGPGWYCVVTSDQDCETGDQLCVELLEEDKCNDNVLICDGPFDTEELCNASCDEGPPIDPPDCVGHTFTNATIAFSLQTGGCTCLPATLSRVSQGIDTASWGPASACTSNPGFFGLACIDGKYSFASPPGIGGNPYTNTYVSFTASPFELVVDVVVDSNPTSVCPSGSFRVTITDP